MILIAVNSRTVRMQIERLCIEGGLTRLATLMAGTLAEARAALSAHPIGVVVLDDWFPDGRGADLLAAIRADTDKSLPVLSIATRLGAEAGLAPDAEVSKSELVTRLVPELRTLMRAHRPESSLGNVLVVDDSRTYRELLRASLESAGYKVVLAETGEEGVRCAFEQRPDALLVDSMFAGHQRCRSHPPYPWANPPHAAPHAFCSPRLKTAAKSSKRSKPAPTRSSARTKRSPVILARLAGQSCARPAPRAAHFACLAPLSFRDAFALIGVLTRGPLDPISAVFV